MSSSEQPRLALPAPADAVATAAPIAKASPSPTPMPVALQPWRQWLEWLEPEQIIAVGDLLQRLQSAMGAFRGPQQRGEHEPAGIDELRRRGPYHRLLLSEWAIADAAPDEFLRRASSGEHLFLSPRYETRKVDARIVALFDTGPAQLGAPRLAHIALWILLARRAQEAGIAFCWGTTAEPGALHDADSARQLKHFLAKRSWTHADAAAASAWQGALADDRRTPGECWRIGAASADADDTTAFTHQVDIQREWLGALAVRIVGPGGRRDVALPLPPAGAAAKLLRCQFAFEVAAVEADTGSDDDAEKLSLKQPPLIGPGGERIAVALLATQAAMIYTLPRKEGETRAATRSMQWTSGRELMCAVLGQKHFGGIIADPDHLHFWKIDGFRTRPRPPNERFQAPPGQAHWLSCAWLSGGRKPHHVYVLDQAGRLLCWQGEQAGQATPLPEQIALHVLAMARADGERLLFLRHRQQRVELVLRRRFGNDAETVLGHAAAPEEPEHAFLNGRVSRSGWNGAWCMPDSGTNLRNGGPWSIHPARHDDGPCRQIQVRIGAQWRVFGLVTMPGSWEHALVALSPDRRRLSLIGPASHDVLYGADVPIATVSVATDCDVIALVTEHRRLVVLTPGGEKPLAWSGDGEVLDAD